MKIVLLSVVIVAFAVLVGTVSYRKRRNPRQR